MDRGEAQGSPPLLQGLEDRTQETLSAPHPQAHLGFLSPSGGVILRDSPEPVDIHHYQQQEPAHASAPAGAPQEQGRPLEERLGRLEAQMMELREQVVREACGCVWGRAGLALLVERKVGLGVVREL